MKEVPKRFRNFVMIRKLQHPHEVNRRIMTSQLFHSSPAPIGFIYFLLLNMTYSNQDQDPAQAG